MAKGDIDDTTVCKVLDVLYLTIESQTILDTEHNTLAALLFVLPEVGRSSCYAEILQILLDNVLYLVENKVSILRGTFDIEGDILGKGLTILGLWQVSYHDGCILTTFCHLMEVNEDAWVALLEVDTLREEHGCVAVSIERQHTIVHLMGLAIGLSLAYEPLEQRLSAVAHTLRVPLNTKNTLELCALNSLNDTIG